MARGYGLELETTVVPAVAVAGSRAGGWSGSWRVD